MVKIFGFDAKGKKVKYDVIMTFKGSQNFVIYTDNSVDENDNLRVYSAVYDPETKMLVRNVEDEKELEEVKIAFESIIING